MKRQESCEVEMEAVVCVCGGLWKESSSRYLLRRSLVAVAKEVEVARLEGRQKEVREQESCRVVELCVR